VEIINNGTPQTGTAEVDRLGDAQYIVRVMLDDLRGGSRGSYANQLASTYGLGRKGY